MIGKVMAFLFDFWGDTGSWSWHRSAVRRINALGRYPGPIRSFRLLSPPEGFAL
jgi:hypothetical protein